MNLTTRLSAQIGQNMAQQTSALLAAAPRIRAAEALEDWLKNAGLRAEAVAHVGGFGCPVHVVAYGPEPEIADCLCDRSVTFERSTVPDHPGAKYDCNVGSYNVTLIALPEVEEMAS